MMSINMKCPAGSAVIYLCYKVFVFLWILYMHWNLLDLFLSMNQQDFIQMALLCFRFFLIFLFQFFV